MKTVRKLLIVFTVVMLFGCIEHEPVTYINDDGLMCDWDKDANIYNCYYS